MAESTSNKRRSRMLESCIFAALKVNFLRSTTKGKPSWWWWQMGACWVVVGTKVVCRGGLPKGSPRATEPSEPQLLHHTTQLRSWDDLVLTLSYILRSVVNKITSKTTMSQPETTTNPLSTSWEAIPATDYPIRTSSLLAATASTEPETALMEVPVNAASPPAIISPEGPYDLLIASAIQATRDGQLDVGSSSPPRESSPAPNLSVPRHTIASIWPEPEADKDEGCGLKHLLWACVAGVNYICCMT